MDCPNCGFNSDVVRVYRISQDDPFPERLRWTKDPEHRKTLQFYSWFLGRYQRARILDLGSGPGTVAVPLCWLDGVAQVTCFDVDRAAREALGKTKNCQHLHKLEVCGEQGQPHDLPFESSSFDVVVCRYSMHHFPDQPGTVREIRRCMSAGGLLLYSDPAMPAHSRDATDHLYRKREKSFHGYRTYHEMVDLLAASGFRIIAIRPYDYQRGTIDDFLAEQQSELRQELIRDWLALDERTKREMKWSGHREGPFITYPIIDIAADNNS